MCIIAAPEGLDALRTAHPDIDIYVGNLDEKLNEDAYIVPGLGDAGDRIFGTNNSLILILAALFFATERRFFVLFTKKTLKSSSNFSC